MFDYFGPGATFGVGVVHMFRPLDQKVDINSALTPTYGRIRAGVCP
jgi:hypothetical protein